MVVAAVRQPAALVAAAAAEALRSVALAAARQRVPARTLPVAELWVQV